MLLEDSPPYTSSVPAPPYSQEPSADEERLALTLRTRRLPPTGNFTKKSRQITLTLYEQDDKAVAPLYEHRALVSGVIKLDFAAHVHIHSVVLKLECRIELDLGGESRESIKILSDRYTLWKESSSKHCPNAHPFAFPFGSVYTAKGRSRPLPPSYEFSLPGGFSAKCIYTLKVRIFKSSSRLAFWTKPERLDLDVHYRPRTCPPRPILYAPMLYTIKPNPEEWHQIVTIIPTHSNSKVLPITCNLFIPSTQIYGFSEIIPYHIQLSGPLSSFRTLFDCSSPPSPSMTKKATGSIGLRVFLSREVAVEVYGQREKRVWDHSEGTLRAMPPLVTNFDIVSPEDEIALDWEGEVQCTDAITTTGFLTDMLAVKDLIVVSWSPSAPLQSPLLPFRHAQPIKLVTDPWTERAEHPRQ